MQLTIDARNATRWLLLIVASLTFVHVSILTIYFYVGDPEKFDFIEAFDFDYEGNIPTLFSSFILFLSAVLFYLISRVAVKEKNAARKSWLGMALLFTFLALDEGAKLHEYIGDWVEGYIDASGYLYFPWVLPYLAIFLLLAISYFRFFLSLPKPTRTGLFWAAAIYVCGAAGLDIISAREADINGTNTIWYSLVYTVEEVMEMLGVILLIHTLLRFLAKESPSITLQLN